MDRLLKKFRPALRSCLQENGYVTRELVLEYSGESTKPAMRKLREAWPRLLQDEELVEIRVNKSVRWKYGLPAELESNKKIAVLKEGVENVENPAVSTTEICQNRTIEWHSVSEEDRCGCVGSAPVSYSPFCGTAEAGGTLERELQAFTRASNGSDRATVIFKRRGAGYETSRCEALLSQCHGNNDLSAKRSPHSLVNLQTEIGLVNADGEKVGQYCAKPSYLAEGVTSLAGSLIALSRPSLSGCMRCQ
jgi:hypothetical protein